MEKKTNVFLVKVSTTCGKNYRFLKLINIYCKSSPVIVSRSTEIFLRGNGFSEDITFVNAVIRWKEEKKVV